jgi:hypothetical protein
MVTEARGMRNEPQIRSNLHNLAGIVRTKRNQSVKASGLLPAPGPGLVPGSARGMRRQGGLQQLLFRRRTDPKQDQVAEAVLTDA